MRKWLISSGMVLSSAAPGPVPPVPEQLVYELAHSILNELQPQARTWYQRGADGKYHWQRATPNESPVVRLLLQDRLDGAWCKGLMCANNAVDSAQFEVQLLQHFTAADLAYMRQQLPQATRFAFQQAKIKQPWVRVVPVDTLNALRKRLGWQARIFMGDSVVQRYGNQNWHHISHVVFTKDYRRALVTIGDAYNGYTVAIYRKKGAGWQPEKEVMMVQY